jgi:hypothetical protein
MVMAEATGMAMNLHMAVSGSIPKMLKKLADTLLMVRS